MLYLYLRISTIVTFRIFSFFLSSWMININFPSIRIASSVALDSIWMRRLCHRLGMDVRVDGDMTGGDCMEWLKGGLIGFAVTFCASELTGLLICIWVGLCGYGAKQLKVHSFRSSWRYCCWRLVHFHTFIFHFNSCFAELSSDEVGNRKF